MAVELKTTETNVHNLVIAEPEPFITKKDEIKSLISKERWQKFAANVLSGNAWWSNEIWALKTFMPETIENLDVEARAVISGITMHKIWLACSDKDLPNEIPGVVINELNGAIVTPRHSQIEEIFTTETHNSLQVWLNQRLKEWSRRGAWGLYMTSAVLKKMLYPNTPIPEIENVKNQLDNYVAQSVGDSVYWKVLFPEEKLPRDQSKYIKEACDVLKVNGDPSFGSLLFDVYFLSADKITADINGFHAEFKTAVVAPPETPMPHERSF